MAKYTDPNTGVKYSTHTGLKVFTVIVVILLVISIILNAVLYMQNSGDSEMDSGESGEIDNGYGNGDADSSEGDGTPEPGEGIVDTETVIENENAVRTSEFDEHGAATCLYYYYDENLMGESGIYNGCEYCQGTCEGHEYWITKGGAVYPNTSGWFIGEDEYDISSEPDVKTQVLYAEDGSTDINSKIRASLVFDRIFYTEAWIDENTGEYMKNPIDDHVEYVDYYYTGAPKGIEISSLTGEPLEIESVVLTVYAYYENTSTTIVPNYKEYRSANGVVYEQSRNYGVFCPDATATYFANALSIGGNAVVTITLADGNSYSFEYWSIYYPDLMIGAEVVYVD